MLDVAFNHRQRGRHPDAQGGDRRRPARPPYYAKAWWLRRTGIPTLGSWFTRAEQAGGGPLLDIGVHVLDYSLFLLGQPAVTAVSASTYDLLGTAGFGSEPGSDKTGATDAQTFDVEDLATVFMRLEGGGTLLVEASWAAHRTARRRVRDHLFGTRGRRRAVVRDIEPIGSLRIFTDEAGVPAETRLATEPAGAGTTRWSSSSSTRSARAGGTGRRLGRPRLARVVECCYRSAAEGREIPLD